MITAKEYATELVDSIKKEIYWGVITTADFNPERERARINKAKVIALMLVDRMVDTLDRMNSGLRGITTTIGQTPQEQLDYWIEVQQEIENR